MARMSREAQLHAEWIGMAQPDGLVVAVPVLEEAGVYARRPLEDQQALRAATPDERLPDLETLFGLLGWPEQAVSADTEALCTHLPDLGATGKCDSEWRTAINPQKFSSTGVVTTTAETGGVNKTVIDATAGGMSASTKNPYVYISLKTGKRVDIDDYAAKTSNTWDIAFKRSVVRINGGDSGSGLGAISIQSNTTIDKVTSLPSAASFAQDDFLDANCNIATDPIGQIKTAIGGTTGMWYTMDGISKLKPNPDTYVIKLADGSGYVKMVIVTYYGGASNTASANYTIRWASLK